MTGEDGERAQAEGREARRGVERSQPEGSWEMPL